MVAIRFLIREVWQKTGMEQIPLWERYDKGCLWFLARNPKWAEPSVDVERVKEVRDRKSECLSGTWVVEVYLTFTPFL